MLSKRGNINPGTTTIFCLLITLIHLNSIWCNVIFDFLTQICVCVCSSELLSRWLLQSNSRSISLVPWKRFLSLCFSEPVLENVLYVKPLAEHDTASTGPFLQHTHILSFLWLHHCQSLQMEKGSQIPLLVKRRKCSRNIFLSFSVYPHTAPSDSVQNVCSSKVHCPGCQSQEMHSHFTNKRLGTERTGTVRVPILSSLSPRAGDCHHCRGASPQTLPLQIIRAPVDAKNPRWKKPTAHW